MKAVQGWRRWMREYPFGLSVIRQYPDSRRYTRVSEDVDDECLHANESIARFDPDELETLEE